MLEKLRALSELNSISRHLKDTKELNANLPILLKVLAKKQNGEYLLRLGNITLETKSQKELIVGQKYWANLSKSSVGAIIISNLVFQPKMLDILQNAPLKFSLDDLEKIFKPPTKESNKKSKKEILEDYRDFLLDKFSQAQNRSEFLNLGNLLLSLQKNVLSFVIRDKNQDSLVQIKASKQKKQSLEFYAIYPNLGPLNGKVYKKQDFELGLEIGVTYESARKILEASKDKLKGFNEVRIYKQENIEPFFEFEENLLDIKA